MKVAHGEKKEQCQFCGARFHVRYQLKRHLRVQHNFLANPEKHRYMCGECSKTFEQIGHLKTHLTMAHKLSKEESEQVASSQAKRVNVVQDEDGYAVIPATEQDS